MGKTKSRRDLREALILNRNRSVWRTLLLNIFISNGQAQQHRSERTSPQTLATQNKMPLRSASRQAEKKTAQRYQEQGNEPKTDSETSPNCFLCHPQVCW